MAGSGETFEISDSRVTASSVEEVMGVIKDPRTWPAWQTEITEISGPHPLNEGDDLVGRAKLLGFVVDGRSATVTSGESSFEEDVIVGVRMRVRYKLEPVGQGTRITRTLRSDLPRGPMGRVLSFFLKRRLKAMQSGLLDRLVRQSEV